MVFKIGQEKVTETYGYLETVLVELQNLDQTGD